MCCRCRRQQPLCRPPKPSPQKWRVLRPKLPLEIKAGFVSWAMSASTPMSAEFCWVLWRGPSPIPCSGMLPENLLIQELDRSQFKLSRMVPERGQNSRGHTPIPAETPMEMPRRAKSPSLTPSQSSEVWEFKYAKFLSTLSNL